MFANRDRVDRAFRSRTFVLTTTIGSADLTDAVSGEAEAVSLGTPPDGAVLLARTVKVGDQFTGTSISAENLEIGTSDDPNGIMTALNIKTATEAISLPGTSGVTPVGDDYGGVEILATFTPTGDSHTHLSAGVVTIKLFFTVPDENAGF
jgi:hypothetical protein